MKLNRWVKIIAHILGLAFIGGEIFIIAMCFWDITTQGYFLATAGIEVVIEIPIVAYSAAYFGYVYYRMIGMLKQKELKLE